MQQLMQMAIPVAGHDGNYLSRCCIDLSATVCSLVESCKMLASSSDLAPAAPLAMSKTFRTSDQLKASKRRVSLSCQGVHRARVYALCSD